VSLRFLMIHQSWRRTRIGIELDIGVRHRYFEK
jgi:hypothetical protein